MKLLSFCIECYWQSLFWHDVVGTVGDMFVGASVHIAGSNATTKPVSCVLCHKPTTMHNKGVQ